MDRLHFLSFNHNGRRWCGNILFLLMLFCIVSSGVAQTSAPIVQAFSNQQMRIHSRIFSVELGADGVIYAASRDSDEIVAFDGANWFKIEIPSPCAMIQVGITGKIWLSHDRGIGYLQRDEFGQIQYHEFETEFGESAEASFWHCGPQKNGVRFANNQLVYDIDETTVPATVTATHARDEEVMVRWDDEIIVNNTSESKLYIADRKTRTPYVMDEGIEEYDTVIPLNGREDIFVCESWTRLVEWRDGKRVSFSQEFDQLNGGEELNWVGPMSGNRVGCSGRAGFFCLNQEGRVLFWSKGFAKNNLGTMYAWKEFSDGRIGLACENGFAVLTLTAERREWPLFDHPNVGFYASECVDGKAYICSESGLFEIDLESLGENHSGLPVAIHSATFTDCTIDDHSAYFASGEGIFKKEATGLKRVANSLQYEIERFNEDHIVSLDDNGIATIYCEVDGGLREVQSFRIDGDLPHFLVQEEVLWTSTVSGEITAIGFPQGPDRDKEIVELSSEIEFDRAWVQGPIDDEFVVLTDQGILVSQLINSVATSDATGRSNEFATRTGVRLVKSDRFSQLDPVINENEVGGIVKCGATKLALVGNEIVSIHELVDGVYQAEAVAMWELDQGMVGGFWDAKNKLVWQIERGKLVAIDINRVSPGELGDTVITSTTKSVDPDEEGFLKHRGNIKLSVGLPLGNHFSDNVEYQHRLNGLQNDWSEWSRTSELEYQGLPGGTYTFESRARNALGKTEISSLRFGVRYPWYLSWGACVLWLGVFGLTIYGATAWRSSRLVAANRRMEMLVAERTSEIERKKIEIQRNAALLDESERRSESDRLKSLDTLVAGIAHDFNNLLMVMSANNEMIKVSQGTDAEKFSDCNAIVIQSAADLCRELTDYSGSLPIELVSTSFNTLVQESQELILNAGREGVSITYDLMEGDNQPNILADGRILKRALVNLVVNAVECCTEKVSIKTSKVSLTDEDLLHARYVGSLPKAGDFCCLSVEDDGAGIKPEHRERLFDPFYSTKSLGHGLGLAIVMRVVGRHGGVLFVNSVYGRGAKFEICLPSATWPVRNEPPKTNHNRGSQQENLSLLLVDDESLVLQSTKQILEASGFHVTAYDDPQNALQSVLSFDADQLPYDCAVIDISMPELTGPEMAEAIHNQFPELPIVFVSGHSSTSLEFDSLEKTNIGFLTKPYKMNQINEAIRQAVHGNPV